MVPTAFIFFFDIALTKKEINQKFIAVKIYSQTKNRRLLR